MATPDPLSDLIATIKLSSTQGKAFRQVCEDTGMDEPSLFDDCSDAELQASGFKLGWIKKIHRARSTQNIPTAEPIAVAKPVANPEAALHILKQLGVGEAEAKKQVTEGKINLNPVRAKVTDASVTALAQHCPGLTTIGLWDCSNITDTSVTALAQNCPGLTEIYLRYCSNITDASVTALAQHCPVLTYINLVNCSNITDTSVTALAQYCPGLTTINLHYCHKITDASITALAQHCPGLTKMDLNYCSMITYTAKQLLRDKGVNVNG